MGQIKYGNNNITDVKVASQDVSEIYLGDTLLWKRNEKATDVHLNKHKIKIKTTK